MRIFRAVALIGFAASVMAVACSAEEGLGTRAQNINRDGTPSLGNGVDPKCILTSAVADRVPVYLVLMIDRSASMASLGKWEACRDGLEGFLADRSSRGISASLHFFRQQNECSAAAYATPAVAMMPLPEPREFSLALDAITPWGGTPTQPALEGAIQYAQIQAKLHRDGKTAIVLVTDGIPNDCGSDVKGVSALAATVNRIIPTYVIGVGSEAGNLDSIAQGGGTGKAVFVDTKSPQQITKDFSDALITIRGRALSCEYRLPGLAPGQRLNVDAVNVVYTPGNAKTGETIEYSKDCAKPTGWHYDDANAPAKIMLCSSICDRVEGDMTGKIDVVTGCGTLGGVVR